MIEEVPIVWKHLAGALNLVNLVKDSQEIFLEEIM